MRTIALLTLCLLSAVARAAAPKPLKVGVTLHPYYSWTKNVAGDLPIEVRALLPGEVDAGSYQPSPGDIQKLADLDAIVVNGVGHDDFIFDMIKASGNTRLKIIEPNQGVPMIRSVRSGAVNSHTFISFTNAVQQTYAIQRALAELRPDLAPSLQANASAYAKRLRAIKNAAAGQLASAKQTRVFTVHDGYSYLLQEFGLEVAGVVEPAHGLVPSAAELKDVIAAVQREKVKVVLSEESFPEPLLKALREATGAKVHVISHIATGPYAPEKFEREMQKNADSLIQALVKE